ncbi:MAG TPA: immunoglobulin domain-containing protein [Verrucomicrobiae bacterium]|nr:immunoglobulin domain-containing protein [Verrucomicrobiae bacterium]
MKTFLQKSSVVAAFLGAACVMGATFVHAQETPTTSIIPHSPQSLQSVESYSDTQLTELVNDLSATPLIWPTNLPDGGMGGTYWSLAHPEWPPLPEAFGTPFWNLTPSHSASAMSASAMSADSTASTGSSGFYLLDDVDYPPAPGSTNSDGGTNIYYFPPMGFTINTNGLWLEVPTNAYSLSSNYFNVLIHNTTNGDFYDVLTKVNLLLPQWTVENTVTGAVGHLTPVTLGLNGRTNLFVWARTSELVIDTEPMTQEVVAGDTVTFTVVATGGDLSYQWTFDGTNISGATSSSYTINNVNAAEAGSYACIVTSATGSVTSHTATLIADSGSGDPYQTQPIGQRQDYTFRSGVTYHIASPVQLYGDTVFEPGAILKFDYTQTNPTLQVLGTVTCKGTAYNPSVLTTIDDNAYGEQWNTNSPQPHFTGVPYLDLSQVAGNLSLTNVWFRYADEAVSTPANGRLDIWNGQFFRCNASILNESNGVDSLHNVLFAGCQEAVAASTNSFAIAAENITADVSNLYTAAVSPVFAVLTNSIVTGNAGSASLHNSTVAPATSNFQTNGAGSYYLATGSTLHQTGTTNISPYLLNEFRNKTTYAPIALPEFMSLSGNLTLSPQAPRYTNGLPDEGYYYDSLDYTVAGMTNFGTITVLPGTVIGFRQDLNTSTYWGFDLREESSFVSHGTPTKPIVFTDVQWVQEQYEYPCYSLFVPNFEGATNDVAPVMDFRFCNFYPAANWYEVWAGQNGAQNYMASYNSVVNWTMRDCNLFDGWISLGEPDNGNFFGIPYTTFYGAGTVTWDNNLFENESVNLQPSFYWYDGTINVDTAISAENNLLRGGYLVMFSQTSSSGNWTFEDNMFDKINFYQDAALPLDYDYNGYWPLMVAELQSGYTNQFQTTTTGDGFTDGGHEQVLSYAPPFVAGTFGNYYLSSLTPLYEAGSRTAGAAGLAQYTVFTNQIKDAATSSVNIGLHYVAATNNAPLDSDGDGIPDYVEDANGNGVVDPGETDPNNPMTDGVTNDIYNSAYLDTDLSGDGLVGRVKAALGINPLDPNNPLVLEQVSDPESDIATFEIPISYNILTNSGILQLFFNGACVTLEDVTNAADGNALLNWNTTYQSPGQHFAQVQFALNDSGGPTSVNAGSGPILPYYSDNVLQFFESDSYFDTNGAYLDAQLPEKDANYVISLYDPSTNPETLITAITNSTSNGMIQENWNDTYADGVTPFAGANVDTVYDVTLLDSGFEQSGTYNASKQSTHKQHKRRMPQLNITEQGNGFDFMYVYTPPNGNFSAQFADYGAVWNGMQAVVDYLLTPTTHANGIIDNYDSSFNFYTGEDNNNRGNGTSEGWPGYLTSQSEVTNWLYPTMANGSTKNFFAYAHGTANGIGSYNFSVTLFAPDIAGVLTNFYGSQIISVKNPYRFVFLDGCSTASTPEWREAFGIFPMWATNSAARYKLGQQAFVGWAKEVTGWLNPTVDTTETEDVGLAYTEALNDMYELWLDKYALAVCVHSASVQQPNIAPFPVPSNVQSYHISGEAGADGQPYNYYIPATNVITSPIYIIGHSGLTRYSVDANYEGLYASPIDTP